MKKYIPRGWDEKKVKRFIAAWAGQRNKALLKRFATTAKVLFKLRNAYSLTPKKKENKAGAQKPGRKPGSQNTGLPLGSEFQSKGVIHVKTETGWKRKRRVEYEKHYGAVPKNYVIRMKIPGSYAKENFYLVSKANMMLENHHAKRYPELTKIFRAKSILTQTINNAEKKHKRPL